MTGSSNYKLTPLFCRAASGNRCTAKSDGSVCGEIKDACTDYESGNNNLEFCY